MTQTIHHDYTSVDSSKTHGQLNQPRNASNNTIDTDIIIVGAGPIGLSMAKALQDSGLKVHLIEKKSQQQIANPLADGREIAVTHHTKHLMQSYDQWHLIEPNNIHHLKRAEVYNGQSHFALGFDKPDSVHGQSIDTLGYLLSNHRIRRSAYQAISHELNHPDSYLTASFNQHIHNVYLGDAYAQVELNNQQLVQGKLILAADSRVSFMRKALGIGADMHDFGHTVLLFRCQHTISNQQIAHESFYYGKTLAALPLGEHTSSMVITIDNSRVKEIINLSDDALAQEMMSWLSGRLGTMTVVSDRHSYPLLAVHAKQFYHTRSALIGDSAVGMHPVTAHGYNLGMESVDILSRLLYKAVAKGEDIGNTQLLRRYHRQHSIKTRLLYHGTNTIVKLYTNDKPPAKMLRHVGLRFSNQCTPIKRLITAQLTG